MRKKRRLPFMEIGLGLIMMDMLDRSGMLEAIAKSIEMESKKKNPECYFPKRLCMKKPKIGE